MTNIRKLLARNIKAYRQELGMTQSKLAENANTATHYIAMIEGCRNFPSPEMMERIASALGKDSIELFAVTPTQLNWKELFLTEISQIIEKQIEEMKKKPGGAKRQTG